MCKSHGHMNHFMGILFAPHPWVSFTCPWASLDQKTPVLSKWQFWVFVGIYQTVENQLASKSQNVKVNCWAILCPLLIYSSQILSSIPTLFVLRKHNPWSMVPFFFHLHYCFDNCSYWMHELFLGISMWCEHFFFSVSCKLLHNSWRFWCMFLYSAIQGQAWN